MDHFSNISNASAATQKAYVARIRLGKEAALNVGRSLFGQRAHIEDMHLAFRCEVLEAWKQPGANAAAAVYAFGA